MKYIKQRYLSSWRALQFANKLLAKLRHRLSHCRNNETNPFLPRKKSLVITNNWNEFMKWANEEFRCMNFGYESSHWVVTDLPDGVATLAYPIGPFLSGLPDKSDPRTYPEYHALLLDLPLFPDRIACQKGKPFAAGIIEAFLNREDIKHVVVALSPDGDQEFLWRSLLPLLGNTKPIHRFSGESDPEAPFPVYPPEVHDALYEAALTRNTIDRLITYNLSRGLQLALGESVFMNRVQMSAFGCIAEREEEIDRFCSSERFDVYMEIEAEDGKYVGQWVIGPGHPARNEIAKSHGFVEEPSHRKGVARHILKQEIVEGGSIKSADGKKACSAEVLLKQLNSSRSRTWLARLSVTAEDQPVPKRCSEDSLHRAIFDFEDYLTERSPASGFLRQTLESLVKYRKTYVGPMSLVKGGYMKSYSMGYMLMDRGQSLVDSLKGLEIADPTYSARISKELIKLATRESGSPEALIEMVKADLRAFVERLKEVHEVLFNL